MVDLINKYRLQHTRLYLQYWDNILKCSVVHVQHAYQFGLVYLFIHSVTHVTLDTSTTHYIYIVQHNLQYMDKVNKI